jgi:hypothetical protein
VYVCARIQLYVQTTVRIVIDNGGTMHSVWLSDTSELKRTTAPTADTGLLMDGLPDVRASVPPAATVGSWTWIVVLGALLILVSITGTVLVVCVCQRRPAKKRHLRYMTSMPTMAQPLGAPAYTNGDAWKSHHSMYASGSSLAQHPTTVSTSAASVYGSRQLGQQRPVPPPPSISVAGTLGRPNRSDAYSHDRAEDASRLAVSVHAHRSSPAAQRISSGSDNSTQHSPADGSQVDK